MSGQQQQLSGISAGSRLTAFLRSELAPFPGREHAVMRYLMAATLVILISTTLDLPYLSLHLIVTFFSAQSNAVSTMVAGKLVAIGASIILVLQILLLSVTFDYDLLRVVISFSLVFAGIYFYRASPLGAIGYMAAIFIAYVQSDYDLTQSPETLVRANLWIWVGIVYPVVVTVTVHMLFFPAKPVPMIFDEANRELEAVDAQIDARLDGGEPPRVDPLDVERGVASMHGNFRFAALGDPKVQAKKSYYLTRMSTIIRLYMSAARLSRRAAEAVPDAMKDSTSGLKAACRSLRDAYKAGTPFRMAEPLALHAKERTGLVAELQEMAEALNFLSRAEDLPITTSPPEKIRLLPADAFSNPAYAHTAVKSAFAALICYIFLLGRGLARHTHLHAHLHHSRSAELGRRCPEGYTARFRLPCGQRLDACGHGIRHSPP